jgi:hypothetical protein
MPGFFGGTTDEQIEFGNRLEDAINQLGTSWILDNDGKVREVPYMDALAWRLANPTAYQIARTEFSWGSISTVFLGGMKIKIAERPDPFLFESMVSGCPYEHLFRKNFFHYRTLVSAQQGHSRLASKIREEERKHGDG